MASLREIDDTFCIAVLGDFLGAASHMAEGRQASWVPRRATPDTLTRLLGLHPELHADRLGLPEPVRVSFADLDSFRPQSLFLRLDLFAPLRQARESARQGRPQPAPAPSGQLLDAILEVAQPQVGDTLPRTPEELQEFVRAVVRPHLVRPDAEGPARVARVDEAASALMSALLHDPAFQALESLWRSLVFLLSRSDTSGKVRVYALNVSREELESDLLGDGGPGTSRLGEVLARPDLGAPARRWSLAVGAYSFGSGPRDLALLEGIGATARAAEVPWISSFADAPGGDPDQGAASEAWAAFRRQPEASWVGLTYPRFLVREPMGGSGRAAQAFAFREAASGPDQLLWGHGAFLCAALMAEGFAARGWGFRMEDWMEMEGMPQAPLAEEEGGAPVSTSRPLDLASANRLMESGLIPLLPFPSRAALRLGGIRSVACPDPTLGGWWRR